MDLLPAVMAMIPMIAVIMATATVRRAIEEATAAVVRDLGFPPRRIRVDSSDEEDHQPRKKEGEEIKISTLPTLAVEYES